MPVLIFSIDTGIFTCYVDNMFAHRRKSSKSASIASPIIVKWGLARNCCLYHHLDLVELKFSRRPFKH